MKKSQYSRETKIFSVMLALVFSRYCLYGFRYFPQLDDYIQLHNYRTFSENLPMLLKKTGMLAARPFAGLLDVTLWSWLFPSLLSVLILSVLYVLAGMLLQKIFAAHFHTTPLFLLLFGLMPLGFEGLYWISASGRIICGLFFAVVAAYFFQKYLLENKKWCLPLSMLLFFLCCGFYEQGLVFGITLIVLVGILCFAKVKWKACWSLAVLPVAGLFFFLTALVKNSELYGTRLEMIPMNDPYYWEVFLPEIFEQVKMTFINGGFGIFINGLKRVGKIILEDRLFIGVLAFVLLSIMLYRIFPKEEGKHGGIKPYIVGFLLFLAPITPFFVLPNPWFSLRGAVMSFTGIALIGDTLLQALFRKRKNVLAMFSACLAFLFCLSSIAELHDYRQTTLNDTKVCKALVPLNSGGKRIGIFGIEPNFLEEQNFYYHEHIHGVTESEWALTGAMAYFLNRSTTTYFVPLSMNEPYYAHWNKDKRKLASFDEVYYYDFEANELKLMKIVPIDETAFAIYIHDTLFATSYEEENQGYLIRKG